MPRSNYAQSARECDPSQQDYKFVLRLPKGYHEQLAAISRKNRRSMNSEITLLLEQFVAKDGAQSDVERIGMAPSEVKLDESALKLIQKFQELSLEKKKALLDLLD
ncbi:MAG: Arc family DNA-binding protein [Gammaproteobacteria bacterium]|nr:Arc family DNA-binding protein [Gammaproteobacteria bacterium]MDP2141555.1 Arc family DNA-binding protein [Gammaproteobacteria bacterium]MDP2346689.1 Arc family DNA-binding protein [Gammaproteobacteria bacterium]